MTMLHSKETLHTEGQMVYILFTKESKLIKYTWYGSQLKQVENLSKDALMDYLAHNAFNFDAPLVVPQWAWEKSKELGMTPNQLFTGIQRRMKNMSEDALRKTMGK